MGMNKGYMATLAELTNKFKHYPLPEALTLLAQEGHLKVDPPVTLVYTSALDWCPWVVRVNGNPRAYFADQTHAQLFFDTMCAHHPV